MPKTIKWIPKFKKGDRIYSAKAMYISNLRVKYIFHENQTYLLTFGDHEEGSITLSEEDMELSYYDNNSTSMAK